MGTLFLQHVKQLNTVVKLWFTSFSPSQFWHILFAGKILAAPNKTTQDLPGALRHLWGSPPTTRGLRGGEETTPHTLHPTVRERDRAAYPRQLFSHAKHQQPFRKEGQRKERWEFWGDGHTDFGLTLQLDGMGIPQHCGMQRAAMAQAASHQLLHLGRQG